MSTKDLERLNIFITDVYSWLDACYLNHHNEPDVSGWPAIKTYQNLRVIGEQAWLELKQELPLQRFRALIESLDEEKLVAHGLRGAQLQYKLSVIDELVARMRRALAPRNFRPKLVDAIDTLLDSLISATGAGTALKEIKDMLAAQR